MYNKFKRINTVLMILCLLLCVTACEEGETSTTGSGLTKTEVTEETEITDDEKIQVYSGPGTEYTSFSAITSNNIDEVINIEGNWVLIQYDKRRGYVEKNLIPDLCTNDIPRVMHSFSQNVYQYPTVVHTDIQLSLFDPADMYYSPSSSKSYDNIEKNQNVKILFTEKIAFNSFALIEFEYNNKKHRCYSNITDLFALDNPLLNFDSVKETNAIISHNGTKYYSTSGENSSGGWIHIGSKALSKTGWDVLSGIVNVIASNDINDAALKSAEGKIQLYSMNDRQYINANIENSKQTKVLSVADFLLGTTISFIQGAKNTLNLQVDLYECGGEYKTVIRTGTPIEFNYAGKDTTLSSLIVEKNNTPLTAIESSKRADEMIKSMYPELDKTKTYSMNMKFSKDFSNNYGYYIVIDNELNVYAVPIIHYGTTFPIYSDGKFIRDAAIDLASCMIQLDDESSQKILNMLYDNSFEIQGFIPEAIVNIPKDAYEYNGHHYKIYTGVCSSWEEAKKYCEDLGGHLAVISSQKENDSLYNYLIDSDIDTAYFGFSDSENEGTWKWVTEENNSYTNWHPGEPNSESGEDYAELYWKFPDGTWNDGNYGFGTQSDSKNFICEWEQ